MEDEKQNLRAGELTDIEKYFWCLVLEICVVCVLCLVASAIRSQ